MGMYVRLARTVSPGLDTLTSSRRSLLSCFLEGGS